MQDHSQPTSYDPSSPGGLQNRLILVLFITGAVLLVVILAAVEAGFNYVKENVAEEYYVRGNPILEQKIARQEAKLNTFARIKGDDSHVVVPVEVAIEEFVKRNGKKR